MTESQLPPEKLQFWVDQLGVHLKVGNDPRSFLGDMAEQVGPEVARQVEKAYNERAGRIRHLKDPGALVGKAYADWYLGPESDDLCWPPLRKYLSSEKGWRQDVVDSIDDASTKILSLCPPPALGGFESRGLVLGYVQSGKTANFTALMAKAADAGYRMFIVLAGMYDSLRNQTQNRLNDELVNLNPDIWLGLTTTDADFDVPPMNADFVLGRGARQHRTLAVVKKNSWRMAGLVRWLRTATPAVLSACPVMIVDDEADQASLNASRYDDQRTKINELLIELLKILPRHAYVGYTATPFANVLVDPFPEQLDDSLYPRDFIVTLSRPPGYFGAEKIFGRGAMVDYSEDEAAEPLDLIRTVRDSEVSQVKPSSRSETENFEPAVVESLERALEYFWLACAARAARGQGDEHSTMLIHTHQRIVVHSRFIPLLESHRQKFLRELRSDSTSVRDHLDNHWQGERQRVQADPEFPGRTDFDDLYPHLESVVAESAIIMENGEAEDRLSFEDGQRIRIVVGGTTLSRGLTLEGLIVSYFVRSAGAYDTLLQMGRWFGYRQGYADLPRIWITDDLRKAFRDLALVEAEIRRDIARYEEHGLTPNELAVRIRKHPSLAITSRYKMRAAREIQVSYGGTRTQTTAFHHTNSQLLLRNLSAARALFRDALEESGGGEKLTEPVPGKRVVKDVPGAIVLEFLQRFTFHPANTRFKGDALCEYVNQRLDNGGLALWNVASIGQRSSPNIPVVDIGLPTPVNVVRRSMLKDRGQDYAEIGVLTSASDFEIDLRQGEDRSQPLLLIYMVDKDSQPKSGSASRIPLNAVDHLIGVAVAIPPVAPELDQATYVAVDLPTEPSAEDEYEDIPEVGEEAA